MSSTVPPAGGPPEPDGQAIPAPAPPAPPGAPVAPGTEGAATGTGPGAPPYPTEAQPPGPPTAPPPYPAPPPPAGQPPYPAAPAQAPYGYGQPGYGAPGYGQPAYGAPPYGAPGYGTPPYGPMPGYQPYPPYPGAMGALPYAGYWHRLGGWLLDWVLLAVVGSVIGALFNAGKVTQVTIHYNTTVNGQTTAHIVHYSVLGGLVGAAMVMLYGAFLCGSERGQTLGMMAVGVRAVDGDNMTGSIGFGRALWRAFFEYLMAILCFIPWVLNMLWPAWDSRHQTWHDKVSNTVVVLRSPKTLAPQTSPWG